MPGSYRKKILKQILDTGKRISLPFSYNQEKAYRMQVRTLKKMLLKAENTAYGKEHGFTEVLNTKFLYKAFSQRIPLSDYSGMFPYWQEAYKGVEDVAWPGKTEYFALSSGTSEGASKYVPVTQDMLKSINRASIRQIISIAKTDIPKDFLTKDYLMVSGSTSLYFNDEGKTYAGDLSGITSGRIPGWFDRFSKPSHDIRSEKSWQNKIDRMVEEAANWDVVAIAGVPAWIQILFESIIKRYHLKNIHDIWPNLRVYIWGGVALDPYRKSLDSLMGQPIMYFETYLSSEGFVAYQAKKEAKGMRLNFRNGMFFEFVPFTEQNFDENGTLRKNARVLNIKQVQLDKEYAILLSTCAGAWRYLIGDTIKFVDLDQCEIKITGRVKHFLSICGEHLSVDNMNKAIALLSEELQTSMNEFTVKGLTEDGKHKHLWYISSENPDLNETKIAEKLDNLLCELNDDYATERRHALSDVSVKLIPHEIFILWMQEQGKFGSQNKFPRVLTNEKYKEWVDFLEKKEVFSER